MTGKEIVDEWNYSDDFSFKLLASLIDEALSTAREEAITITRELLDGLDPAYSNIATCPFSICGESTNQYYAHIEHSSLCPIVKARLFIESLKSGEVKR